MKLRRVIHTFGAVLALTGCLLGSLTGGCLVAPDAAADTACADENGAGCASCSTCIACNCCFTQASPPPAPCDLALPAPEVPLVLARSTGTAVAAAPSEIFHPPKARISLV